MFDDDFPYALFMLMIFFALFIGISIGNEKSNEIKTCSIPTGWTCTMFNAKTGECSEFSAPDK